MMIFLSLLFAHVLGTQLREQSICGFWSLCFMMQMIWLGHKGLTLFAIKVEGFQPKSHKLLQAFFNSESFNLAGSCLVGPLCSNVAWLQSLQERNLLLDWR